MTLRRQWGFISVACGPTNGGRLVTPKGAGSSGRCISRQSVDAQCGEEEQIARRHHQHGGRIKSQQVAIAGRNPPG